jgi:2-keto-4-pentenoate hydratase
MRTQLEAWKAALDGGARRVGWKIGFNIPAAQQRYGISEPVLGHLTSRTLYESGATFDASGAERLVAEVEVALRVGASGIDGYAAAIELVDLGRMSEMDIDEVVATNIFHRGVVLAPFVPSPPEPGAQATVSVNGEVRERPEAAGDFAGMVEVARRRLAEADEELVPGDVLISGALCVLPLAARDRLAVDLGPLGAVEVVIG